MITTRLGKALGAVCLAILLAGVRPLAVSARHQPLKLHLDTSPAVPAFEFGYSPGFNPQPRGYIAIYGDGTVKIVGKKSQPARIQHLAPSKMNGLLKLAETTGFFSLPAAIRADEPMPDSTFAFITIHTTTVDKTVGKDVMARNDAFDKLFAALYARVGMSR